MLAGYKTIAFNVVVALIFALNQFGLFGSDNPAPTQDQVSGALEGLDAVLVQITVVGNAILRAITSTPIFKG